MVLRRFGNSAIGTVAIDVLAGPAAPPLVVAPDDYTSVAGNTGINTLVRSIGLPRTYQMQFTPDALGGLPAGARITQLLFRLSTSAAANFPIATVTWSDYEVTLAQAANPISSLSTIFQANLRNPVLVKDGALSIDADQFSAGGNPNPFGTLVVLDTPYVYQGGDLVWYAAAPQHRPGWIRVAYSSPCWLFDFQIRFWQPRGMLGRSPRPNLYDPRSAGRGRAAGQPQLALLTVRRDSE